MSWCETSGEHDMRVRQETKILIDALVNLKNDYGYRPHEDYAGYVQHTVRQALKEIEYE